MVLLYYNTDFIDYYTTELKYSDMRNKRKRILFIFQSYSRLTMYNVYFSTANILLVLLSLLSNNQQVNKLN